MRTHPSARGQIFNVVDGTPLRASDYIRRIAQMAGKRTFAVPAFVQKAGSAFLIWSSILRGRESTITPGTTNFLLHQVTISGEKIREVLGWTPAVDLEEGFRRTEQWLRQEGYLG